MKLFSYRSAPLLIAVFYREYNCTYLWEVHPATSTKPRKKLLQIGRVLKSKKGINTHPMTRNIVGARFSISGVFWHCSQAGRSHEMGCFIFRSCTTQFEVQNIIEDCIKTTKTMSQLLGIVVINSWFSPLLRFTVLT